MFTPEAISGKRFQRLTKEKATLAREIDKGKNCWNFTWLEENVWVSVSWERKHCCCEINGSGFNLSSYNESKDDCCSSDGHDCFVVMMVNQMMIVSFRWG